MVGGSRLDKSIPGLPPAEHAFAEEEIDRRTPHPPTKGGCSKNLKKQINRRNQLFL